MLRTSAMLAVMLGLFVAFGSLFGIEGAATALSLAIVTSVWSYYRSAPAILARCGVRHVNDSRLVQTVGELAAQANIPAPWLYEMGDRQPNAFAVGRCPGQACIIITTALRRRLNADEMRAVLAHEISHIANRDTLAATIGVTLLSAIATLAILLGIVGLAARRSGGGVLIFLAVLAPILALILHLARSRSAEYRADREGARLCGEPEHLISALTKLERATRRIQNNAASVQPAMAGLFIVDPLPNTRLGRLFASHPPIAKRIARLSAENICIWRSRSSNSGIITAKILTFSARLEAGSNHAPLRNNASAITAAAPR
jgi:heat shock protein HtpX